MVTAEEKASGGDVVAAAVTTLDLTGRTHIMAGFVDWTATTSGGVSTEKNLTKLGEMGACMCSPSVRVTRTPATSRSFSKVGNIMGRS